LEVFEWDPLGAAPRGNYGNNTVTCHEVQLTEPEAATCFGD